MIGVCWFDWFAIVCLFLVVSDWWGAFCAFGSLIYSFAGWFRVFVFMVVCLICDLMGWCCLRLVVFFC